MESFTERKDDENEFSSKRSIYSHENYKKFKEDLKSKIPIRKGCANSACFCTGECNKIIGYRDPEPGEVTNEL